MTIGSKRDHSQRKPLLSSRGSAPSRMEADPNKTVPPPLEIDVNGHAQDDGTSSPGDAAPVTTPNMPKSASAQWKRRGSIAAMNAAVLESNLPGIPGFPRQDSFVRDNHPVNIVIEDVDEEDPYDQATTFTVDPEHGFSPDLMSPAGKVLHILIDNEDTESVNERPNISIEGLTLHALFCQMDVLCHFEDGVMGWKESARWLKYEEKVEAGDRWSKPHVATTSLHALFELRNALSLNNCTVILDLSATHGCMHQVADDSEDYSSDQLLVFVAEILADSVAKDRGLSDDQKQSIVDVLLKPHKHKHRTAMNQKQIKKKDVEKGHIDLNKNHVDENPHEHHNGTALVPSEKEKEPSKWKKLFQSKRESNTELSALKYQYPGSIRPDNLKQYKPNKKLMGKMPGGSEAANILIGQVDFLETPVIAFVRLRNSAVLADMTEVAIPTRFVFLVLGPPDSINAFEYEEVGRAAASLFSDRVFCELAYKAHTRQDLVDGVDEFIDDLIVLPPSIWDPSTRLQPPEQTISMDKIKRRLMDEDRFALSFQDNFHMGEHAGEDESLRRTGRLFGGLVNDIKRRYPLYWSDIRDALHPQCLASVLFLYFACITPIVTFGGLMGSATDGQMGTMETMLAGAICGLLYHTFAGQPLTIVGATGPMLIFESILYTFCATYSIHFLSFRFYIGMWTTLYLLIFVAFDLSSLVKFITRFTEESFSVLISLIFIYEAFKKLFGVWKTHPVHIHAAEEDPDFKCHCEHPKMTTPNMSSDLLSTTTESMNTTVIGGDDIIRSDVNPSSLYTLSNWSSVVYEDCITHEGRIVVDSSCITEGQCTDVGWELVGPACNLYSVTHSVPDVFFLSCFLFLGTFAIAYFFKTLRNMKYFPSIIRTTLSDFAVLVGILSATLVDFLFELDTPKLNVPEKFETTVEGRGWVVNPVDIGNWYLPLLAAVPAILATILVFLDQQITAVIVNRKEHKLKKGHGYHLDLFVLCFMIAICSTLALPWFVAATVRAITHVRSLMKESELKVPGERPQFLGVREQRLTGILVHVLIGLSVLLTGLLKHVPMPVLYGVFFYMGVSSLRGVQFVDRIKILFMPEKYQPDHIYLRHVSTKRVHIFTIIQIVCMILMWVVKSTKQIAITFPVMILALCFVRKAMDWLFTQREMFWLDHLLPESTRKAKEDEDNLGKEDLEDNKGEGELKDHEEKIMQDGDWNKIISKRDYGVGRKARKRQKSESVIARYMHKKKHHKKHDPEDKETDVDDTPKTPTVGMPFKDRAFSF